MIYNDPEEDFDQIKELVRDNAFRYTHEAFGRMVDRFLYEEDVKRAFSTARLDGLLEDEKGRIVFALSGFSMNEETLLIACRMSKNKVVVLDVDRAPQLPGDP
ncbi:MAG TPA: hypothetical protein VF950_26010 [Planctomycetota bacterium]